MLPSWPATLPLPLTQGQGQPVPVVIATQMETGRIRQRRISDSKFELVQCMVNFDFTQFQIFRIFFDTIINQGTDWFEMELRLDGSLVGYTVRISGGNYTYIYTESLIQVTFMLELDLN